MYFCVGIVFLAVSAQLYGVTGYSAGPPPSVCSSLMPNVYSHGAPSTGNGGYLITTDIPLNSEGTSYEYASDTQYTSMLIF